MKAPEVFHQALDLLWKAMMGGDALYGEGLAQDDDGETLAILTLNLDPKQDLTQYDLVPGGRITLKPAKPPES